MKSRIRSRWYRSNEKPLESSPSESSTSSPLGEISLSEETPFKDDLSGAKPKSNHDAGNSHRKRNGDNRKPHQENRDRRKKRGQANRREDKDNRGKHRSRKSHPKNQTKNGNRKDHSSNEGSNSPRPRNRKYAPTKSDKASEEQKTQSKVGKFISKLFGG